MACDVFLSAHARTGQPVGVVATGPRGAVSLHAVSRDTLNVTVLERGRTPARLSLSRRGSELFRVIAAMTARPNPIRPTPDASSDA